MAKSLRKRKSDKRSDNRIKNAADGCREFIQLLRELGYAYRMHQYKKYKKCAKFNKKTGFWKFKKLKKIKKAKLYAKKPIKP